MGLLKSRRRSKWYDCFRPEKRDDFPFEPVPCLANGGKESNLNLLRQRIMLAFSDDDRSASFSDDEDRMSKKSSKPRRSLSRSFKAVLLPMYSGKKNRSRKSDEEKSFRSNSSSISTKLDKVFDSFRGKKSLSGTIYANKETLDGGLRTDSSGFSLFSASMTPASSSQSLSSTRTSSIASNSRSASERKKSIAIDFKQLEKKPCNTIYTRRSGKCCKPILGLYFLLVCLLSLVLCGKALAVCCTSACLFWIPCCFKKAEYHQSSSVFCPNNNINSSVDAIVDIDSDDHKKKVVMEGLLERNRIIRVQ